VNSFSSSFLIFIYIFDIKPFYGRNTFKDVHLIPKDFCQNL